jgi:subtilisin family serine protease
LPGATLKAANMFERNAAGSNAGHAMALLRGLDWLLRERVSVINMSIAGGNNAAVEKGIAAAHDKGVAVVAAAGNWGRADKPAYPAAIEQVFAVTAIDSYDGIYELANKGNYIDFAAPGVNVLTAAPGGGSRRQSGTSFAAPFLTAILALEIANGRGGNVAALQGGLARLSRDLGPSGRDPTYGAGFVQARPQCT